MNCLRSECNMKSQYPLFGFETVIQCNRHYMKTPGDLEPVAQFERRVNCIDPSEACGGREP